MTNHLMPIPKAADLLSLTDRRLRQHCEAGAIPRPERGMVDPAWALHFIAGTRMISELASPPTSADVVVALAWATGCGGAAGAKQDRALLVELFERNGKTRDDALLALGAALAMMAR
jgi:hypothetical protein